MGTLTKASDSSPWVLSHTIAASGVKTFNLSTAGTFLDRNIGVSITTPSTSASAGAGTATLVAGSGDSASTSNTSLNLLSSTPSSGTYYTLTATGKGLVSYGTGWITGSSTSSNTASLSKYITKSVHGSAISGSIPSSLSRTSGTYQDIEIQPYGYLKIPAGYNPVDRYVWSNKADAAGETTAASSYSLNVSSISGSSAVSVGTKSGSNYPIIANNLSVTATLTAGTAGWFSSGSATDSDTDNVTVGTMPQAAMSVSGTNTVTPSASLSGTNITLSGTNNGITVVATGGGSASITATTTTSTAGYAPASTSLGSQTITGSGSTTSTQYISGVKLAAPSSGTRTFNIAVPNGNTTDFITFRFTVDSSGNVTIDSP